MAEDGVQKIPVRSTAAAPAVFVSYAAANRETADGVCHALEAAGIACWIAPRDVVPGEFYADAIVRAIDATRATVLVLSSHSAASHHVLREVERASAKRHPVISFRIDGAALPASLEYFLNSSQWLDARTPETDRPLPRLVEAVRRLLGDETLPGTEAMPASAAAVPPRTAVRRSLGKSVLAGVCVVSIAALASFVSVHGRRLASAGPASTPVAAASTATAGIPAKSVVVLPFLDLSERKDQEYFADGLAEELLNLLARVPDLKVPARSSSFSYKGKDAQVADIARELGVANVLEGTVRKAGDTVRVSVELVRMADGLPVWSEIYDRNVRDIFKVQDEISAAVVEALKAKLTVVTPQVAERRSANPVAYDQYLLGVHLYRYGGSSQEEWQQAATALRRSIEADPAFAPPYAALAMVEYLLDADYADHPDPAVIDRALAHADRAVALAPDLADAYSTRGNIRMNARWDWAGTRADLDRALALAPNDGSVHRRLGYLYAALGQVDQYVAEELRACELDPRNVQSAAAYATALIDAGKINEARAVVARIRSQSPNYFLLPFLSAEAEFVDNRPEAAKLACAEAPPASVDALVCLAIAEQRLGNLEQSQAAVDKLVNGPGRRHPYAVAEMYAAPGDATHAFEWLERALVGGDRPITNLKVDWAFAPLHSDPRYAAILRRLGVPG
jgi:TolB-like protein/Tfp pilus assembly protein PilF